MYTGQSPLGDLLPPMMLKPRDLPGGRFKLMTWYSAPLDIVVPLNREEVEGKRVRRDKFMSVGGWRKRERENERER